MKKGAQNVTYLCGKLNGNYISRQCLARYVSLVVVAAMLHHSQESS